jgi:hypothetical protein
MLHRAFIREGDTLEPHGGTVKPVPQTYPQVYGGKHACFEGDPVYCNACKTWGVTKCVPPLRPMTGPDGRQINLDGDFCLCKCSTPPRLKASQTTMCMGFEGHELPQTTEPQNNPAPSEQQAPAEASAPNIVQVNLTVYDHATGLPMPNRTVLVRCGSLTQTLETDAQGVTPMWGEIGQQVEIISVLK